MCPCPERPDIASHRCAHGGTVSGSVRRRGDRCQCRSVLDVPRKACLLIGILEFARRNGVVQLSGALSDFLVREVRKIAEQPTAEEMLERLKQRERYKGKRSPTEVLREEREAR